MTKWSLAVPTLFVVANRCGCYRTLKRGGIVIEIHEVVVTSMFDIKL